MIERALGWLKANPALGLAAAGVGAVLVIPQLRSASGGGESGDPASAAAGPSPRSSPYMPILAGSDLAVADVATAVREGNALIVNQGSQQSNALLDALRTQAAADTARHAALTAALSRPPTAAVPAPAPSGPQAPPPTPVAVPSQPAPRSYFEPAKATVEQLFADVVGRGPSSGAEVSPWVAMAEGMLASGYSRLDVYNALAPRLGPFRAAALAGGSVPAPTGATRFPPGRAARSVRHTVRGGESLATIAERYRVPGGWATLYAVNRNVLGTNPNRLQPGQRLTVPATRS
jgi:hypothetical protein